MRPIAEKVGCKPETLRLWVRQAERDRAVQDRGHPPLGPWRSLDAVEIATLRWVVWFDHRRPLGPIGNIPPAEADARFDAELEARAVAA